MFTEYQLAYTGLPCAKRKYTLAVRATRNDEAMRDWFRMNHTDNEMMETLIVWFYEAVVRNNAIAQYGIGVCYMHGLGRMEQSTDNGLWWLTKSVNRCYFRAAMEIGDHYERLGNRSQAIEWCRVADKLTRTHVSGEHAYLC